MELMSESKFYNLVSNSYPQLQKGFPVFSSKTLAIEVIGAITILLINA